MGLKGWVHWLAHLITSYVKVAIIVVINVILLFILAKNSSALLLLIFFLLYAGNVVWFAFAMSTFFQSGKRLLDNKADRKQLHLLLHSYCMYNWGLKLGTRKFFEIS